MKNQFELARSFLRQVIDKGRHLHDSDGEGLSEDEPGEPKSATALSGKSVLGYREVNRAG